MSDNERLFGDLMSLPLLAGCKTVAEAELRSPMMVDMRVFGGRFEQLPHPDASFDTVVPTLVLCSVREPTRALQEIRRVLRPNGTFLFLEHVADDDPQCLAWQRRIEPFWKRMAGNCHLQRRTCLSMQEVGFTFDWLERDKMRRALPFVRSTIRGSASIAREGVSRFG